VNILITGANGFLGSWLCQLASSIDDVKILAAVRVNANTEKLKNLSNTTILSIDYSSKASLVEFFSQIQSEHGDIDLIIHNAGLTKSTKPDSFFQINTELTERLVAAVKQSGVLKKGTFSYVSSQAALGPMGCHGPVSAYGESKLAAEKVLIESDLDYLIFRPTGIYGPGDNEFLALFKTVKSGIYPCAAPINQKITLIHVHDVAKNIIELSLTKKNQIIHLSDGTVYTHSDLKSALDSALNKKSLMLMIPTFLIIGYLRLNQFLARLFAYEPILTVEKHGEISKDWNHDFSLERKEIPLAIKFDLQSGFANTSKYYQSQKLL
jgi:UDP-glucose 4-epimerase